MYIHLHTYNTYIYTAMAEIIKPIWSFVKIDLNIQWSLFTEHPNKAHYAVIYYLST